MEELLERTKNLINVCWDSFSAKVGGGVIAVNKEASMQLQFAYLLKSSVDLIVHHPDEIINIELETSIQVGGRTRECDIEITIIKNAQKIRLPIEMKCYKTLSSSGKPRGAQDLFRYGVYEDMELIESYVGVDRVLGIQLTMTDSRNFVYPKSKEGKSWDYDISHGTQIDGGTVITTDIGGKPASATLTKSYSFNWVQQGDFYFLKLDGNTTM